MKIRTLPVYSKLAETAPPEFEGQLPQGWRLSQHQVETYLALTGGEYDVVFNTAMTGDGKTLAGQLPALLDPIEESLLAMYSTNELIRDQDKQLDNTRRLWNCPLEVNLLSGAVLDDLVADSNFSQRAEAILNQIFNSDVLLTNPDIFHYIMQHFYRRRGDAPDTLIGELVQRFSQFTFDEFHIFETPQIISVINAMLFIDEIAGRLPHRFLFLSATPDEQMNRFLEQARLRYRVINPSQEGWYTHSDITPSPEQWRRILHATEIHFATGLVEAWVEQNLETLLNFFVERTPNAKGAIIVNSIASAKRLTRYLTPFFAQYGLTVRENTGLTSAAGRADSYQADLLIGTSTVDVGVDFNINFLLFESRDSGTFLQRLGRLGRHDGYKRNGKTYAFHDFVAYALVPDWMRDCLFKGGQTESAPLAENETFTRQQLTEAIQTAYPRPVRFDNYIYDWGKYQSVNVIGNLNNPTIRTQYSKTRDRLGQRYEAIFNIRLGQAWMERKGLAAELTTEAMSFRGGSYFQCAILDNTETGQIDQPKLADLFMLAANGQLEEITKADFYQAVEQAGLYAPRFEQANYPHGPLAYYRLHGWTDERREVKLRLHQEIFNWGAEKWGQAIVLTGLRLDARIPGRDSLNRLLERRKIPATLCLAYPHPLELKRRLYLPLLFPLFPFVSLDEVEGCVAFGREALLLHTLLIRRKDIDCQGQSAFIF